MSGNRHAKPNLFNGTKFWFSSGVPQRRLLMQDTEAHGGVCVATANQADVVLVDHLRRDNPPGSFSYQYVERSIRRKELLELELYRAGPPAGSSRPVGSLRAVKGRRNPFTVEDDRILWDYVKPLDERGESVAGNKIYKEMEKKFPQHTYQSWRERYLKRVRHMPASAFTGGNALAVEASAPEENVASRREVTTPEQRREEPPQRKEREHSPRTTPKPSKPPKKTKGRRSLPFDNTEAEEPRPSHATGRAINILKKSINAHKTPPPSFADLERLQQSRTIQKTPDVTRGTKRRRSSHSNETRETPLDHAHANGRETKRPRKEARFSFSSVEFEDLLKHAKYIVDIDPEYEEQAWQEYAGESGHTAAECREYFNEVVLPEYIKRLQRRAEQRRRESSQRAAQLQDGDANDRESESRRRSSSIQSLYFDVLEENDAQAQSQDENAQAEVPDVIPSIEAEQDYAKDDKRQQSRTPSAGIEADTEPKFEDGVDGHESDDASGSGDGTPREPSVELGEPRQEDDSSSPVFPQASHVGITEKRAALDTWMEDKAEQYDLVNTAFLIMALERTTFTLALADLVIESLVKGEGVPEDIPGVWTEEDDEGLQEGNEDVVDRITRKHGRKWTELRRGFLDKKVEYERRGTGWRKSLTRHNVDRSDSNAENSDERS